MKTGFDLDWFVVVTAPQQEMRARMNLDALGVTSWMPKYSKVVRQRGETRFVERMLFPGYLFVAFEPGDPQWMVVRAARGVISAVTSFDKTPIRISSELVSTLMCGCLTGLFDVGQRRIGSKVRIASGEFSDMLGRIVKAPDDDKLTVMLLGCGQRRFEQIALDRVRLAA